MFEGIDFPAVSPIIFSIGGFSLRWYSMAYLVSIVLAWILINKTITKYNIGISKQNIEDLAFYATIGIILGGRLGYVLFYGGSYFWHHPLHIFYLWQGGMSFHGGLIGTVLAMWYFAKKIDRPFLQIADLVALFAPIGLFLGRLANFVNDELWGTVTHSVPWAVKFPSGGFLPRHPSQIYEALTEGLLLLIILNCLFKNKNIRNKNGIISGCFVAGYGFCRFIIEFFRQPDAHIGHLWLSLSMGQILCIPMILFGIFLILRPSK